MSQKSKNFDAKKKGGRRKPKSFDRDEDKRFDEKETQHKYNDVSWYTKNSQMLIDAASYSYNNPVGSPVPWQTMFETETPGETITYNERVVSTSNGARGIPGLYTFEFIPTIGKSADSSSPANIAAQNIYSYVRYMNSGAKNYDQADLMLYLMAMDSAYMMWSWLKRIYGYLRTYSQYNKYMPMVYAQAESLNFDDLISHLADLRLYINQTAAKLSAFCVPAVMPLFIRHSWMCSNIYKDSDLLKAQQYMFIPRYLYQYDETGSEYGGQLIPVQITGKSTYMKYSDLTALMNSLIDAVAYSEDIGVMSGDILKAYGESKLFKLVPLEPDYMVEPVYNEEVLNQMHNSTTMTPFNVSTTWKVTQDPSTGYLIFNPQGTPGDVYNTKFMVNMPWDSVTPANTMVGTRLMTVTQPGEGTVTNPQIAACGSEIIVSNKIWYMYKTGVMNWIDVSSRILIAGRTGGLSPANTLITVSLISQFDWHPMYWLFAASTTGGAPYQMIGSLGDVSNYTMLNEDDLVKLHYTAIMSEFNIPQIGAF